MDSSTSEELQHGIQQLFTNIEWKHAKIQEILKAQNSICKIFPPWQLLLYYISHYQMNIVLDLQLHILVNMAFINITHEDLFCLIDSSYIHK